jgi:FkbM family methyltransferase
LALPSAFSSGPVFQPLFPAAVRVIFHDGSIAPLMSRASVLRNAGNKLYEYAFPIYRPLYATYKAYTDRAERQLLREVLFPGAVAVDAGANIGIYSRFLARRVGPAGVVHSFEPAPENFKRLRAAMCRFSNVHVYQVAIGERSGRSQLYLSENLNVDHRVYPSEGDSRDTISMEVLALDDYFSHGDRVDLIKLDVQGYELHALRGANRVLYDNPGIKLILELWPYGLRQATTLWPDLIVALEEKGMFIRQMSTKGLTPFRHELVRESVDWYTNLFASRE